MAGTKEFDRFAYPPNLINKAEELLVMLESEIATATGALQQFLGILIRVVRTTIEKGSPSDRLIVQFQLKSDLAEVVHSFSKAVDEGRLGRDPSVILRKAREFFLEAIAWLQETLAKNGVTTEIADAAGQVAEVAESIRAIYHGFEAPSVSKRTHY